MEDRDTVRKERISFFKYKKEINISIYGAFSSGRINKLTKLRDYLRGHGYNAKLSIDLEKEYPRKENESKEEYNRRISEILIRWGDIHIFVFFCEHEGEFNVNQSASMELEGVYRSGKCDCVVLYFEEGSLEQMRSLLRGLVSKTGWDYEVFENIEDIFDDAIGFCSNCIHKIFGGAKEYTTP